VAYVELHCHSAFSFLDGASQPEELAARAAELGYEALALTDHDGVYGSLEFAHAAKFFGVRPITGAEVTLERDLHITLLVESREGYANLCRILTAAHAGTRRPGHEDREPLLPSVPLDTVAQHAEGLVCLSGCARRGLGVETVATGNVHAHHPQRTLLQDVLVAIRCRTALEGCEPERRGNRESFLRSPEAMLERFSFDRAAAERSGELAARLRFDLTEELGYRYPDFSDREDPAIFQLAAICRHALTERYADVGAGHARPLRQAAAARLEDELKLIEELGLAGFFLLHHEVLEMARECALEVRRPGSPRRFLPP